MEKIGERRGRKQSTNKEKRVKTRGKKGKKEATWGEKCKKKSHMGKNQPVTVVGARTAGIGQYGAHVTRA